LTPPASRQKLQLEHTALVSLQTDTSHELHGANLLLQELKRTDKDLSQETRELQRKLSVLQKQHEELKKLYEDQRKLYEDLKAEREQLYDAFLELRRENSSLRNVIRE
jgi:ABC-type transporter Mla subunit MlaD